MEKMKIAPPWLFGAQALYSAQDPHLAEGIHLKIMPSFLLGLPIMPFFVYRVPVGRGAKGAPQGSRRQDIVWKDSKGRLLTAPFEVSHKKPVTGWLPPFREGICGWIYVNVSPKTVPIFFPLPPRPWVPRPWTNLPGFVNLLRIEGLTETITGPGVMGSISRKPYMLNLPFISRIKIIGQGKVNGVSWLDLRHPQWWGRIREYGCWRAIGLPVKGGKRYIGLSNAEDRAWKRVKRGAPKRKGLHEAPASPNPYATPSVSPDAEYGRVKNFTNDLIAYLDHLLNDLSDDPWSLSFEREFLDDQDKPRGKISSNCLGTVLNAALDPGVGRWLGFGDVDDEFRGNKGEVVVYFIQGIWQYEVLVRHLKATGKEFLIPAIENEAFILKDFAELKQRLKDNDCLEEINQSQIPKGPYLELWTAACATVGYAHDRPSPPRIEKIENGPWLPTVEPPEAEREITINISGVLPGAILTLAREQNNQIIGVNPSHQGYTQALLIGRLDTAEDPGEGILSDRKAPPGAIKYRVAQADLFGRWSNWRERPAPPKDRPRPSQPVLYAFYRPPEISTPVPEGPLQGTIRLRVPVPEASVLPPGARALSHLEVEIDGTIVNISLGNPPPKELVTELNGPFLSRTEKREVTISARWVDSSGEKSPDTTTSLIVYDPRPPAPPQLSPNIRYASRPDVEGISRIKLSWMAEPTQRYFKVFYTDENRLKSYLEKNQEENILSSLEETFNIVEKAQIFVNNKSLFKRDLFELLTKEPAETVNGKVSFEHQLSGSLKILSFYRVVAVSEMHVESPFEDSPLIPIAVPSTDPPPQPLIEVYLDRDNNTPHQIKVPYRAKIRVKVPPGLTVAREYRLRRTASEIRDHLFMPVVQTGEIPPAESGQAQEFEIWDDGSSLLEPNSKFRPWVTYHWCVEVRGAPDPGGPSGMWSRPSTMASAMFIPPDPPEAPQNLTLEQQNSNIILIWEHPKKLIGGTVGPYQFEIYRKLPEESEKRLKKVPAYELLLVQVDSGFRFQFEDTDGQASSGTRYRIVVVDPIGRTSPPSEVVEIP